MTTIDHVFLTFVLNAFWQIAIIAAAAALCASLLGKSSIRYKHILWVTTLTAAFLLPVATSVRLQSIDTADRGSPTPVLRELDSPAPVGTVIDSTVRGERIANGPILVNRILAWTLISIYILFLLFRAVNLLRRWIRTRNLLRDAHPAELGADQQTVVAACQSALGIRGVRVLRSPDVSVPIAFGVLRPGVIVPEHLLLERDLDVLTSAIGHEFVHIARRDYLLNLIYELIYLPLSFHPGAALVRRRINQTRELRSDELVTERLLDPDVYARSLVKLAGAALPSARRVQTIAVGIADADILEVRIMSLLREAKPNKRGNRLLLVAASLLLAVPCAAAGALALRFNIDPADAGVLPAERMQQDQQNREQAEKEIQMKEHRARERAEQEMKEREMNERAERDPAFRAEMEALEARRRAERELEARQEAALARMARFTMDQAIQIAINQQPGKVLQCSLVGEHWVEPGQLAKDSRVLYHVIILTGDESNPTKAHVLIDAIDGSVVKMEKEERNKESSERRGVAFRER
jgi:bla regulator protein blaR1